MRNALIPPLLLAGAAFATLLLAARGQGVPCAAVPVGCGARDATSWSLACYVLLAAALGLTALAIRRVVHSIGRQRQRTHLALQPLLALPSVAAPADLAALLRGLHVEGRTRVIALDTPVALCHGLARPRLLLSTGTLRGLSGAEMEAVLRHEWAHLRRRDPLRLIVIRALADALPALPVLRQLAAAMPLAQELAADRAVLSTVGVEALGGALLKIGDALGPLRGQVVAVGAFSMLDARINQILGVPIASPAPSPRALLPLVSVFALSPFLCVLLPVLWCVTLTPTVTRIASRYRRHGPVATV